MGWQYVRSMHPNLFYAIVIFGLWGIFTAFNFLLDGTPVQLGNWKYLFGVLYLIFGSMKLIGLSSMRTLKISRLGMIGCMVLSLLICTIYLVNYVNGSLKGWQGTLNFFTIGVVQLTAISEPAVNPLNMRRGKNDS